MVYHVSRSVFMVFHGSRSVFMVLMVPLSRFVFHSSRLDFYGFSLFIVYGFYVFFHGSRLGFYGFHGYRWVLWVFMVPGGFSWFFLIPG